MMKKFYYRMMVATMMTLCFQLGYAQQYVTVMKGHFNLEDNGLGNSEWLELEKEYHENVILKNEYIKNAAVLYHFYTPDMSEILFINVYDSWDDIQKAAERSDELVREHWADEDERRDFYKKQLSFYDWQHSDEIYAMSERAKMFETLPDTSMVYYLRKRRNSIPPMDGSGEEMSALRNEWAENVLHKNEYLKAYYPMRHLYGADSRDIVEIFVVEDMEALDKMEELNGELANSYWDSEELEAANELSRKYTELWHGDWLYQSEPALMK